MNKTIIIRTTEDKIEEVEIIDDKGNRTVTDSLNVTSLERENLVEALEEKANKIEEIISSLNKKMDNLKKIKDVTVRGTMAIIGTICIIILADDMGFKLSLLKDLYSVIPAITYGSLITMVMTYVLTYRAYTARHIEYKEYGNLLNSIEKELDIEKEKGVNKVENVCELSISDKLLNSVNEKYSLRYGDCYKDLDYKYELIRRKKEAKAKKAYYESIDEYVNYDEIDKPKTLGSKKK